MQSISKQLAGQVTFIALYLGCSFLVKKQASMMSDSGMLSENEVLHVRMQYL
jgi:hypothetical protein